MDFFLAVFVFPALLLVLGTGVGLLVEWLSGFVIAPALIPPLGIVALIGFTQLTTTVGATAPATPWLVLAVGIAGLALCRGRLRAIVVVDRGDIVWPLLALIVAYGIAIAPVLFAGRVTLTRYLLDTTSAIQILGAERIIEHGRHFATAVPTSTSGYLGQYFGAGYPSGAHTVLGGAGRLIPVKLIWLYQPYLAFMEALVAPVFWYLGRRLFGFGRAAGAGVAIVAAVPALVYAYQLMGAIKEIAALPVIALMWTFIVDHRRWLAVTARGVIPVALAVAAGIGAIGLAFGAWIIAAIAVLLAIVAVTGPRLTLRAFVLRVGVGALVGGLATLPTLRDLRTTVTLANSLSNSNAAAASDPGNLLQPLHALQVLGVWINGDHRVDPSQHLTATYVLIGFVLLGAAAGVAFLLRRGAWVAIAAFIATAVIWYVLTKRGTTWTDAKLIVLTSPLAMLLALGGLGTLLQPGHGIERFLLVGVVAFGVLWSDAAIYHQANLAPTNRFNELAKIDSRFAGQGPALFTDFDEYALVLAAHLSPDQPGFARHTTIKVGDKLAQIGAGYGSTLDLDQIDQRLVEAFPLIVARRSPEQSRPPSNYALAWQGTWYDVWRRTSSPSRIVEHLGTYTPGAAAGVFRCKLIRHIAADAAHRHDHLAYALHGPVVLVDPQRTTLSAAWASTPAPMGISLYNPGRLSTTVRLPRSGRWLLWLRADIYRPVTIYVDGRRVGALGHETGGDRNYLHPLALNLSAGRHNLSIVRGGGSLAPADGTPSTLRLIAFELPLPAQRTVVTEQPSAWRSLCRRQLDWLEIVR